MILMHFFMCIFILLGFFHLIISIFFTALKKGFLKMGQTRCCVLRQIMFKYEWSISAQYEAAWFTTTFSVVLSPASRVRLIRRMEHGQASRKILQD